MTQKKSMAALAALLLGLVGSQTGLAAEPCALCTVTESGTVKGVKEGEVIAFKSIPYAAPPTGDRRFRPPQPAQPWSGVYEANRFRSTCPQTKDPFESYSYPPRVVSNHGNGKPMEVYDNEDCLHLSVWTPAADNKKRPIMVFIPGGAFLVGNGSSDAYTGQYLAKRDVVVVTLNYRVGLLGYMELGQLDKSYSGSGNNGLRDQIAAIEWVKRNAPAFGGDPTNITVFGESAGSISVFALMSTAEPSKLFHRAIAQSGGANLIHAKDFAYSTAKEIIESGKLNTVEQLIKASPLELLALQATAIKKSANGDTLFAPYYDGKLIVGAPNTLLTSGHAKNIDLMVGANQNEMNYWDLYDSKLRNPFTDTTDMGPAEPIIPTGSRLLLNLSLLPKTLDGIYGKALKSEDESLIRQAQNDDVVMIQPMTRLAEMQSANNQNTYLYRFQWKVPKEYLSPGQPDLGAVHSLELPFVFGTLDYGWVPGGEKLKRADRNEERELSDQMMDAWTNFARTGNPNGKTVPEWPRYDTAARKTMLWGSESYAKSDPDSERRQAWSVLNFGLYPDEE
jgi:para-nitrobenzyl esterase